MSGQSVMLINMPWAMPERPSIELGILQSVLSRAGIRTQARSFNLAFVGYLASVDADLPEEERFFSVTDYSEVATYYYIVGLGDWVFSVAPFRDADKESDEQYFDHIRATTGLEEMIAKAVRVRELVPAFLERCVEDVLAAAPRVVGFTTVFNQNVPSLVLAKLLKLRDPSLHVVFGGGNCDGPMGEALHRAFPWVDTVVRGEGEHVLPELVRDLFAGRAIRPQPGLCYRQGERRVVVAQGGGADGLRLAERLFHADSEVALEIVEMLEPGDAGADERWRLALYGMNRLLDDLGFDGETNCAVLKRTRDSFAEEFRAGKELFGGLREKYRTEGRGLEEMLRIEPGAEHPLAPGLDVLRRRSARLAPIVAELKACEREGRLTCSPDKLAQSYLHMHANRLLRSAHRTQELVIYNLLARLYESQLARGR